MIFVEIVAAGPASIAETATRANRTEAGVMTIIARQPHGVDRPIGIDRGQSGISCVRGAGTELLGGKLPSLVMDFAAIVTARAGRPHKVLRDIGRRRTGSRTAGIERPRQHVDIETGI